MTLKEELDHGVLSRVSEDEPIFVLRARDRNAPATIREWIGMGMAISAKGVPIAKLVEAGQIAECMEDWARDNADGGKLAD